MTENLRYVYIGNSRLDFNEIEMVICFNFMIPYFSILNHFYILYNTSIIVCIAVLFNHYLVWSVLIFKNSFFKMNKKAP